jgi:carboxylesterase
MGNQNLVNPHLEGDAFYWPGGPTGILLIHGFSATTSEVRPLGKFLHKQGFTVAGPLLPGHFTKPEDLNRVTWQDWVNAVEAMYNRLRPNCQKVIVGGESTGGLLSLYLAANHPEIAALLLYAPALRLTLKPTDLALVYLISPFIPWITPKSGEKSATDERWQGYRVRPLKGLIQLLRLQKRVQSQLKDIHQPILIVQGRKDFTVHPSVPETISNQVQSVTKEILWFDHSSHCVILDQEIDTVFQDSLQFIHRVMK